MLTKASIPLPMLRLCDTSEFTMSVMAVVTPAVCLCSISKPAFASMSWEAT